MHKTKQQPPIIEETAKAAAKSIASKVWQKSFIERKSEFYETTKRIAEKRDYKIDPKTLNRLDEILASKEFEGSEALRAEWWRTINTVCVDMSPNMSYLEKFEFKMDLKNAKTHEEMKAADERWLRWYVRKFGSSKVSKEIPGSGYFEFFADKLKDNSAGYLSDDWYLTYMFHMINETARISVGQKGGSPDEPGFSR